MLVFSFNILFLFLFSFYIFILESRVRVRVTSQSHCHTSVTSDDMVTVTVINHEVTEKNIEGSRTMISYNIYNIC